MTLCTETTSLTTYLIERTPAVRKRQLQMLKTLDGLCVTGAGTGAEADVPQLMELRPDVVLIGLNALEGDSLTRIRSLAGALPDSTLIVLANEGTPQMRRACLLAGANYCFDKTLEVRELRALLLTMADAVRQKREL
jgi:DNA-binding NarL/FixJ family response regulator